MTFYEKVIAECGKAGVSASQAMQEMGLNKSALTHWKNGKSVPNDATLARIANYFGCSLEELSAARVESLALRPNGMRKKRGEPLGAKPDKVPLLGTIACGDPILAVENIEEMIPVPPQIHADFALRCKGDSMVNARIFPGDIVYIRKQEQVENGQIAAVLIEDEATLKRVYVFEDYLMLVPENPKYDTKRFYGENMNRVQIIGKAVAVTNFLDEEEERLR